jgi:uncharacterized protein (TIGR02246 family)
MKASCRIAFVVALGWACSAMVQSTAPAKANSADANAIRALGKAYEAACNAGDLDRWTETFTDDAIFFPPDHPLVAGRLAIRDWAKRAFFDPYKMQLTFSFTEVSVSGDWAFTHGPYTLLLTPKDGSPAVQAKGKFIDVFRRRSDGWRFARVIFNSDTPPASAGR